MIRREEVWLDPTEVALDPDNTNSMTKRQYAALVEAIKDTGGLTENIVVVDMTTDPEWTGEEQYMTVSGEHRLRAAIDAGIAEVPARVYTAAEWDKDMRDIQGVRHNAITGDFNPLKFSALVKRLSEKYGRDTTRELMKFTDKAKFDKLVDYVTANIPDEFKEQVDDAKRSGRMENIDQLSTILNEMFMNYGDTLPHNFMILDYGGKQHVWIKLEKETAKSLTRVRGELVRQHKSADDLFNALLQNEVVLDFISELPRLDKPDRGEIFRDSQQLNDQ